MTEHTSFDEIVDRCCEDPDFGRKLKTDPRGVLAAEGYDLPEDFNLEVLDLNDPSTTWIEIPNSLDEDTDIHDDHRQIITRCHEDSSFSDKLKSDPKQVLSEYGIEFPQGREVSVIDHREDKTWIMFQRGDPTQELGEHELDAVVGGRSWFARSLTPAGNFGMAVGRGSSRFTRSQESGLKFNVGETLRMTGGGTQAAIIDDINW